MLFSSVVAFTERRDMGLYEVALSMDGDNVSQFPYVWYYMLLRAVLIMFERNASPGGPMCFRCLIFSLSGPCELFIFTLFYYLLDLSCGDCNAIPLYFLCCSVNGSVCLVCYVFDRVFAIFWVWLLFCC